MVSERGASGSVTEMAYPCRVRFSNRPFEVFATHLAPLRRAEWVVYAKRPLRHPSAALLLRRLSTGGDHARPHATIDNRPVNQSATRDADSPCRYRPNSFVTPLIASRRSVQCTSATDRQRRNPHSA